MNWLQELQTITEAELQAKKQADADTELSLWRSFVQEADRIYRAYPKTADSWNQCREYRNAAVACCRDGDIPAARVELAKALEALKGITFTQQDLL